MEFKYILSRKRPFSRFMHSLCGKAHCRITKEIAFHLTRIIT